MGWFKQLIVCWCVSGTVTPQDEHTVRSASGWQTTRQYQYCKDRCCRRCCWWHESGMTSYTSDGVWCSKMKLNAFFPVFLLVWLQDHVTAVSCLYHTTVACFVSGLHQFDVWLYISVLLLTMQIFGCVSPDPMFLPKVRQLSVETSLAGEDGLMTTILPQDLVIALLADRLLVRLHTGLPVNSIVFSEKWLLLYHIYDYCSYSLL